MLSRGRREGEGREGEEGGRGGRGRREGEGREGEEGGGRSWIKGEQPVSSNRPTWADDTNGSSNGLSSDGMVSRYHDHLRMKRVHLKNVIDSYANPNPNPNHKP